MLRFDRQQKGRKCTQSWRSTRWRSFLHNIKIFRILQTTMTESSAEQVVCTPGGCKTKLKLYASTSSAVRGGRCRHSGVSLVPRIRMHVHLAVDFVLGLEDHVRERCAAPGSTTICIFMIIIIFLSLDKALEHQRLVVGKRASRSALRCVVPRALPAALRLSFRQPCPRFHPPCHQPRFVPP